jgi:17beta-estradiol 17-dehydrogenase / very-long-chain 3-oxoacyl-CoA reductase
MAVSKVLATIGGLTATYALYKTSATAYHFLRPSSLPRYLSKDPAHSSWALITGSTDGIGYAFAHELLSSGFNVLLHGRNEEKLQKVQAELLITYPNRSVEYTIADAVTANDATIAAIVFKASNLPGGGQLRILVNNVGTGSCAPLVDCAGANIDEMIAANVRFPTQLTASLLPLLTSNAPTLIFNLSSVVATINAPYMAVYSGAKAYALSLSASLGKELRAEGHDVEVLAIVVGPTDTTGARFASLTNGEPLPNGMDPRAMARGCLNRVGCGRWSTAGPWGHFVMTTIAALLPESVFVGMMKDLNEKTHKAK